MIKEGGSGAVESNLDMVIRKVTNGHARVVDAATAGDWVRR